MTANPRKEALEAAHRMPSPDFSSELERAWHIEVAAIRPVAAPLEKALERWDKMSLVIDSAMAREAILDPRAQHHAEIVSVLIHDTRAALAAYRGEGRWEVSEEDSKEAAEQRLLKAYREWVKYTGPMIGTKNQVDAQDRRLRGAESLMTQAAAVLAWHLDREA